MARDVQRPGELFLSAVRAFQQTRWQPAVDVCRTARGWLLKYELAGVSSHEIELSISGNVVSLRGARRDARVDERQESLCMEISYNQFERHLQLPCDLSAMDVETDYRDGMLFVRLTCKEQ